AAARAMRDEGARAEVLSGLAPHLGEPERSRALAEALAAARAIRDVESRAEALSGLAPRLVSLPGSSLVRLWSNVLHNSSVRERRGLLSDLKALSPLILALGGPEGAREVASAILDSGRWWP